METELMLELLPYRDIPRVVDEIESIESGQPRRRPMFFFHDDLGLIPICPMGSGPMLQTASRRESNSSDFAQASVYISPVGLVMPRNDSDTSELSYRPPKDIRSSNKHPQPINTTLKSQDSTNSTPSIGRSNSSNSGRDSCIENINPAILHALSRAS